MKTLTKLLALPALALLAPLAGASIYTGSWNNTTFDTTGALTIDFVVNAKTVTGSIDFDGPVFGGGDPLAIPLNAKLKKDGSGFFLIKNTAMGDLAGTFDADGTLTITITNIPGDFLTEARVNGQFKLGIEKFNATYEIDTAEGLFAEGYAEAHVPQKPVLKVAKKVKFTGKSGKANARVVTNTGIRKLKATASGDAKVKVTGENPYKIVVSKTTAKKTRVKVTVTNDDGFKRTKTVTFIKQ